MAWNEHNRMQYRLGHLKENLEDVRFSLKESALLFFRTHTPASVFVSMLNKLYDWHLFQVKSYRVSQLGGSGAQECALYAYYDVQQQQCMLLVTNPVWAGGIDKTLAAYDKLLIIHGFRSFELQRTIYAEMSHPAPCSVNYDDYAAGTHERLRHLLASEVVEMVDYFDFSRCGDAEVNSNVPWDDISLWKVQLTTKKSKQIYAKPGLEEEYAQERQYSLWDTHGGDPTPAASHQLPVYDLAQTETSIGCVSGSDRLSEQRRSYLRKLRRISDHILSAIQIDFHESE